MIPTILIPIPKREERLDEEISGTHSRWVQERNELLDSYPLPQNIRFNHNPNWKNESFWSIQSVHNSWWKHPFWAPIGLIFWLSWSFWDVWYIIKYFF